MIYIKNARGTRGEDRKNVKKVEKNIWEQKRVLNCHPSTEVAQRVLITSDNATLF